jgi:hypothetical protein
MVRKNWQKDSIRKDYNKNITSRAKTSTIFITTILLVGVIDSHYDIP